MSQSALLPFDLTPKIGEYIDIHLLLKVLSFYEEKNVRSHYSKFSWHFIALPRTRSPWIKTHHFVKNQHGRICYRDLSLFSQNREYSSRYKINNLIALLSYFFPEMEQLKDQHMKTLESLKERKFLKLFEDSEVPKTLCSNDNWNLAYLQEHHQVRVFCQISQVLIILGNSWRRWLSSWASKILLRKWCLSTSCRIISFLSCFSSWSSKEDWCNLGEISFRNLGL